MLVVLLMVAGSQSACQPSAPPHSRPGFPGPGVKTRAETESLSRAPGQTIYVPIYSHVYSGNNADPIQLAVTLSIRNTDARTAIVLRRASYHDSSGKLVREYLETPLEIAPLAATELFLTESDTRGGAGASFLIEWLAEEPASEPLFEAVHVSTASGQGLIFTTTGRPITPPRPAQAN